VRQLPKPISNAHNVINDERGASVARITIRNLDTSLKSRLWIQATIHGRSMEDEARDILRSSLNRELAPPRNLATDIRAVRAAWRRRASGGAARSDARAADV